MELLRGFLAAAGSPGSPTESPAGTHTHTHTQTAPNAPRSRAGSTSSAHSSPGSGSTDDRGIAMLAVKPGATSSTGGAASGRAHSSVRAGVGAGAWPEPGSRMALPVSGLGSIYTNYTGARGSRPLLPGMAYTPASSATVARRERRRAALCILFFAVRHHLRARKQRAFSTWLSNVQPSLSKQRLQVRPANAGLGGPSALLALAASPVLRLRTQTRHGVFGALNSMDPAVGGDRTGARAGGLFGMPIFSPAASMHGLIDWPNGPAGSVCTPSPAANDENMPLQAITPAAVNAAATAQTAPEVVSTPTKHSSDHAAKTSRRSRRSRAAAVDQENTPMVCTPEPSTAAPVIEVDNAEKYRKMLLVGVPRAAVEHRMKAEGVDPVLLDAPHRRRTEASSHTSEPSSKTRRDISVYTKMLAVGIPRQAVQHRMRTDGVDPALLGDAPHNAPPIEAAGATTEPPAAESAGSAEKYLKMLTMGVPRPAVEHRMRADGVDPLLLDAPAIRTPAPTGTIAASATTADDPALQRFRKMLAMGVPKEAVAHRMRSDGMDPARLDGTSSSTPEVAAAPHADVAGAAASYRTPTSSPASTTPPALTKYKRMLSMGIPADAVRHRMRTDGVCADDVARVIPVSVTDATVMMSMASKQVATQDDSSTPNRATAVRTLQRRPSLPTVSPTKQCPPKPQWQPGALAGMRRMHLKEVAGATLLASSWWAHRSGLATASDGSAGSPLKSPESCKRSRLTRLAEARLLFGGSSSASAGSHHVTRRTEPAPPRTRPSVLETRRAANVSIVLARYGYPSFDRVWQAVQLLEPTVSGMTDEALRALVDLLPSDMERDLLTSAGATSTAEAATNTLPMPAADAWLLRVAVTDRFVPRTRHLLFKMDLASSVATLQAKLTAVHVALSDLHDSPVFETLLDIVAEVVKAVAEGASSPPREVDRAGVVAFRLSSLPSLASVKSFDKRLTATAFIASLWSGWSAQGPSATESLSTAIAPMIARLKAASALCWDAVNSDMRVLRTGARSVRNELTQLRGRGEQESVISAYEELVVAVDTAEASLDAKLQSATACMRACYGKYAVEDAVAPEALCSDVHAFLRSLL